MVWSWDKSESSRRESVERKNKDAVLSLPIVWLDLNFLTIKRATEYDYDISGVDYIHTSTMELNSITKIISADKDFDQVDFIQRIDPLEYK